MQSNIIYTVAKHSSRLHFSFVQNGFSDGVHTLTVPRAMPGNWDQEYSY